MNTILSSVIIVGVYAWEKTDSPFYYSIIEGSGREVLYMDAEESLSRQTCLFNGDSLSVIDHEVKQDFCKNNFF